MFLYCARRFSSNFILTRASIYEKDPDIPPLVNNSMFDIKPTNSNRYSRRSAVLGLKQGMTAMWDKWGVRHALTVILIDRCHVVQMKSYQNNYYLQLGVSDRNIDKISKPLIGHYMKANLPPKKKLMDCKVSPECVLPVGYELKAQHFVIGQLVDVKGTSKGKGFQGGIKRWNFS